MGFLITALREIRQLGNPLVRDFTESAEEKMVKIASEVQEDDNDLFSKYILDPFGRWLDKIGCLEILIGVDNYQKSIIDCYNYSAVNIREICSQMRDYDRFYGQLMATSAHQADNVCRLTAALAECLNVDSTDYSPQQPVSDRILWFRTHWIRDIYGEQCQVSDIDSDAELNYRLESNRINITEEEVVDFCSDSDSVTLFEEYNDYVFEEAMDWSALDIVFLAGGSVLYKGVEMTIDEFFSLLTNEGYFEKVVCEQLNQIISSVISAERTAQTFLKDYDTAKEAVESLISDYLKNEDNNSAFKSFVEAMGGMTAVKELATTCPELLDYLFSDYKKGLSIIEDIAKMCRQSGTAELRAAVDRLQREYSDKWEGLLYRTKDFSANMISKLAEKEIKDWIRDEIGDTSVIWTVLDIADIEDKVDGSHKLIALRQIAAHLQDSYEDAIEKIKSGSYEEKDLEYAKNMFSVLKETTKSAYETYRDMCTDAGKQIWCNKQIAKIDRIQMNGYNGLWGFEN